MEGSDISSATRVLFDGIERELESPHVDGADVQVLVRIHPDVVDLGVLHLDINAA